MELVKKIWFDTNSMPPKNMIWYRGKGKFWEWSNDKWVVAYDLGSTPSQEELNDIADVIEDKTGEELQDKSLSGVLNAIVNAIPKGYVTYPEIQFRDGGELTEDEYAKILWSPAVIYGTEVYPANPLAVIKWGADNTVANYPLRNIKFGSSNGFREVGAIFGNLSLQEEEFGPYSILVVGRSYTDDKPIVKLYEY